MVSATHTLRRNAGLLAMAFLLAVGFFLVPPLFFPGPFDDLPRAFAAYWSSGGSQGFPADLHHLVEQNFGYHLVRAAVALPLLGVLVALAVRLRQFRLLFAALSLAVAALMILNVQGFVSPFGTLLPQLASRSADAELTADLAHVRDQLAHGPISPALHVMLDEYVRWHVVKGVLTGLLAAALAVLSVQAWRRDRRWYSLLPAAPALGALLVVVANATTVANPEPGLSLLLQGG
ncbi:hypothetical protein ACFW6S_04135 [Streptomyces sp. NPDC058740]|uniref:hypothetical protein n=1 Tax=Streptomyces sp. NPDC058740 TaxID=3346619 RepID=UPI003686D0BA